MAAMVTPRVADGGGSSAPRDCTQLSAGVADGGGPSAPRDCTQLSAGVADGGGSSTPRDCTQLSAGVAGSVTAAATGVGVAQAVVCDVESKVEGR